MSDYKVGDKFVIEIGEKYFSQPFQDEAGSPYELYKAKGFNSLVFNKDGLDKLEPLDSDYVNKNFGELQEESYKAGRKAGTEETLQWQKMNEEEAYKQGWQDAWKLAKSIVLNTEEDETINCSDEDVFEPCVYDISLNMTPQEAYARAEAYKNDQIKVGDIITTENGTAEHLVLRIENTPKRVLHVCNIANGYTQTIICNVKKTGKHIDIESILSEIRKE